MIAPVPKTLLSPGMIVRIGTDGCMIRGADVSSPWFVGGSNVFSAGVYDVGGKVAVGISSRVAVKSASAGRKWVYFIDIDKIGLPLDISANWDAACRWVWVAAGGATLPIGESAPRLYRLPMSSRWRLESAAGDVLHFRGVKTSGDADAPELVPGLADAATPAEALALIVKALS